MGYWDNLTNNTKNMWGNVSNFFSSVPDQANDLSKKAMGSVQNAVSSASSSLSSTSVGGRKRRHRKTNWARESGLSAKPRIENYFKRPTSSAK